MEQFEFKPGQYTTRDGCSARVEFVLEEPSDEAGVLVGQRYDGTWHSATWKRDGNYVSWLGGNSLLDLMPPTTKLWALLYTDGEWSSFRDLDDIMAIGKQVPWRGGCVPGSRLAASLTAEFDTHGNIIPDTVQVCRMPQV